MINTPLCGDCTKATPVNNKGFYLCEAAGPGYIFVQGYEYRACGMFEPREKPDNDTTT